MVVPAPLTTTTDDTCPTYYANKNNNDYGGNYEAIMDLFTRIIQSQLTRTQMPMEQGRAFAMLNIKIWPDFITHTWGSFPFIVFASLQDFHCTK